MGAPPGPEAIGEVAALKRKLEALNYVEGLDSLNAYSAPLAKRLLDDVVHTTERYRSLKMQETRKLYELEGEKKKAELLRQENGRLLKGNNELHLARIKDAEAGKAGERSSWLAHKKMEDELAELRFWKTQAVVRFESLEKERDRMRGHLQKQLADDTELTISDPLVVEADASAGAKLPAVKLPDPGVVDLVRLADERVAASSELVAFLQTQQTELADLLSVAQATVQARENEIQRLNRLLEGGRHVDDLFAEYEKKATEELLTSLHHQVEYMTKELAAFDEVTKRKEEAEQQLQRAEARVRTLSDEIAEQRTQAEKTVDAVLEAHALLQSAPDSSDSKHDPLPGASPERMNVAISLLRTRAESLRTELDARNEQLEELQEATRKQQEHAKALKKRAVDAEKERGAVTEQLQRSKDELASVKRELVAAKSDLSTKQMRIQKPDQECRKHKEAAAKAEAEYRAARASLEAAGNAAEASRGAAGGRKDTRAEGGAGEKDLEVAEMRKRIEGLEQELQEAKELARSAGEKAEALQTEVDGLQREVEGLEGEVARKNGLLERMQSGVASTSENGVTNRVGTKPESELAAKESLVQELQERLRDVQNEAELLQRENARLVAGLQAAAEAGNGDQLLELQAMLGLMQEELRNRDMGAIGGQDSAGTASDGEDRSEGTAAASGAAVRGRDSLHGERRQPGVAPEGSHVGQSADVSRLTDELSVTKERLADVSAERDSLADRIDELVTQVSELQWTLKNGRQGGQESGAERRGGRGSSDAGPPAESDGGRLRTTVERLRFELGEREADLACLQEDYEGQAKKMQETMEELSQRVVTLDQKSVALAADKERAEASLEEAVSRAKEVQAECQRLQENEEKRTRNLEQVEKQCATAVKELQESRTEALKLRRQLAEADLGMGTRSVQGDELQRQCVVLRQSLLASRQRENALEQQVRELTAQRDRDRTAAAKAEEGLLEAKHQLENAEKDEEQLKTLITQLDATREDLVAKLRASLAAERVANKSISGLEDEKADVKRELDKASAEVSQLRQVVDALDRDRDTMQGEVDVRAEEISRLVQETASAQGHVADLRMQLDTAEHRLASAQHRADQAEEEVARTREHLQRQTDANKVLQEECDIKAGEMQSLSDDLANLTREHQHVSQELVQVAEERNALQDELERVSRKLEYAEQLLRAKEKEHDGLLTSLQQLGEENQRLSTGFQQAQHDIQHLQSHIVSLEDTLQAMQDHIITLEGETHQQIADLQAYERQCDSLSRSLAQQAEILEGLQNDKAGLQSQLATAKQVTVELEHSRSYLQREIAAAEARTQTLQARLQDADNEKESLMTRLQQEHGRVRELEQLLARVRAQEHVLEVTTQDKGLKTNILQERLHTFDRQVSALQQQVDTLQAIKDAQDAKIGKLQSRLQEDSGRPDSDADKASASGRPATAEARWERTQTEQELGRLRESYHKLQEDFAAVSKEKEDMLGLLSKLDNERSELRHRLHTGSGGGDQTAEFEALRKRSQELEERVKESDARRETLEAGFEALVGSVGEYSSETEGPRGSDQIEKRVANVLSENHRLRESLAAAMAACSSTEADLQRIRQEYAALTEVLHTRV